MAEECGPRASCDLLYKTGPKSVILTHISLHEEGRRDGWTDQWRENVILTKLGVIVSSSPDSLYPTTSLFPLLSPHLALSHSFTNTWAPDDWLQGGYHCSGFTSGADDCDNNYLKGTYYAHFKILDTCILGFY